jgi:hypothetical protein
MYASQLRTTGPTARDAFWPVAASLRGYRYQYMCNK